MLGREGGGLELCVFVLVRTYASVAHVCSNMYVYKKDIASMLDV